MEYRMSSGPNSDKPKIHVLSREKGKEALRPSIIPGVKDGQLIAEAVFGDGGEYQAAFKFQFQSFFGNKRDLEFIEKKLVPLINKPFLPFKMSEINPIHRGLKFNAEIQFTGPAINKIFSYANAPLEVCKIFVAKVKEPLTPIVLGQSSLHERTAPESERRARWCAYVVNQKNLNDPSMHGARYQLKMLILALQDGFKNFVKPIPETELNSALGIELKKKKIGAILNVLTANHFSRETIQTLQEMAGE